MNIVSASDGSVPSKLRDQKGPIELPRPDVNGKSSHSGTPSSPSANPTLGESMQPSRQASKLQSGEYESGEYRAAGNQAAGNQAARWQDSMRAAIRCPRELCERLGLGNEIASEAAESLAGFPVFVPLEFMGRIQPGDPDDPLLRQVLPSHPETVRGVDDQRDPVGDLSASLQPGLIQKYSGRALMVVTGACAVHCRYCFRRHFPYGDAPKSLAAWQPALDTIAQDDSIREVLLSGGDPLTVVDSRLSELAAAIGQIPHVRRLRVHTRLPVMIPDRVNDELIAWMVGSAIRPIVVVHVNHAQEIDGSVQAAFRRLIDAGICVLNQAVLLRGVNDTAEAQAELCERLADVGVLPYYLHQLDRVLGASHFEVSVDEGIRIVASLRERLPGYAVPRYVREVQGEVSKVPLELGEFG